MHAAAYCAIFSKKAEEPTKTNLFIIEIKFGNSKVNTYLCSVMVKIYFETIKKKIISELLTDIKIEAKSLILYNFVRMRDNESPVRIHELSQSELFNKLKSIISGWDVRDVKTLYKHFPCSVPKWINGNISIEYTEKGYLIYKKETI